MCSPLDLPCITAIRRQLNTFLYFMAHFVLVKEMVKSEKSDFHPAPLGVVAIHRFFHSSMSLTNTFYGTFRQNSALYFAPTSHHPIDNAAIMPYGDQ